MSDTGHKHGRHCWVSASSGIPPQQALFNGSACATHHPLLQLYSKSDAARKLSMHTQARLPGCGWSWGRGRASRGGQCIQALHGSAGLGLFESEGRLV